MPFGGDRQFSGDDHCFRGGGGGVCGDDYPDGSDQRRRDRGAARSSPDCSPLSKAAALAAEGV